MGTRDILIGDSRDVYAFMLFPDCGIMGTNRGLMFEGLGRAKKSLDRGMHQAVR